jgi:D-alanyl-D-alanine carboxypeptidase
MWMPMFSQSIQAYLSKIVPGQRRRSFDSMVRRTSLHLSALFLLLALIRGEPSFAQNPAKRRAGLSQLDQKLEEKLLQLQRENGFPGATLGFILPDGRLGSMAVGLADRERSIPMRPGDRMLSGSVGKTYVAALTLRLTEQGKASLDANISQWLGKEPWFSRLPNGNSITLRMLLNHSSGLRNHVFDEQFVARARRAPDAFWQHEELVKYDLDKPPLFEAGKGFAYSDTNYILVGLIIEKITGRSYYRELEGQILKPLKLRHTSPSDRRTISGMVSAYTDPNNPFGLPGKVCFDGKDVLNPQIEWTGGGLASTAPDLARWAWLLLGGHVLKDSSLKEMLAGVPARSEGRYGLGIGIHETDLGPAYGHDGEFPGFNSVMAYFPRYKIAVALQFNTDTEDRYKVSLRDSAIQVAQVIVSHLQESHPAK